ncbi:MAG: glycosyltransferase family 2 protein [Terriglobales bacterium]
MINGKCIAVVLPAYNAEKTLEATVRELPDLVDIRILVDDHSSDRTVEVARQLGLQSFVHNRNYGYGRNQQTCYREALAAGADVVIMVHPDYQYTPLLVTAMASMIAFGVYDVVLANSGRAGAAGWNAAVEIRGQPIPDAFRKHLFGREVVGISLGIPGVQPHCAPGSSAAGELGRFCL